MVKRKAGLPSDFDLRVSREELLEGPARLPGYLERASNKYSPELEEEDDEIRPEENKPTKVESKIGAQQIIRREEVRAPLKEEPKTFTPQNRVNVPQQKEPEVKASVIRPIRLQVNLSADAQLMVEELVEQIAQQSPEKGVTLSDVIQGLIISLYQSRNEMDVSQLPLRGRWGSPTAKSFSAALSEVFSDAIKEKELKTENVYRNVVGG
jgi:hypothetical protein